MPTNQQANVDVNVNGESAEQQLTVLAQKADIFRKKMESANKAGDIKQYTKAETALKKVNKQAKALEKQMWDVDKVLRNLGGSSMRDLLRSQRQLNQELNSGAIKRNSKEWTLLTGKLKRVNAEIMKVRGELKSTQPMLTRMADGFNKYFGLVAGLVASFTGVIMVFRQTVDVANEFEASLANLSALTGLVGDDLAWLEQSALSLSGSTTEAGIRITASAQDILDAYTQMGSKRPELLKDKAALASVTKEAIILSQAARMDLVPATNSLAISMNQFNAAASDAPRYINSIAAGSKAGAGDVLYIAAALEKSGTAADVAGLSIEETIAVIETIAPKFSKPSRAGTQLKNVFVKLQTGIDKFNPSIVGMEQALNNLGDAQLSVNEMVEIFKVENLNAAQTLIANREEYVRYLSVVTDSNVAVEQAILNSSTNKAKLDAARQSLAKYTIELGTKLAPALTFSTSSFSYMVKAMLISIKFFKEYGQLIAANAIIIGAYTIAINASAIAQKAYNIATAFGEKVTRLFTLALASNPFLLAAVALTTLITTILFFITKTDEAAESQSKLNEEIEKGKKLAESSKDLEERARITSEMSKRQLTKFKQDAQAQLDIQSEFDEKMRLSRNKYLDEVAKLEKMKSGDARYIDIISQRGIVKTAGEHFAQMTTLRNTASAEELQGYIDLADEKLALHKKSGVMSIDEYVEANAEAFANWKAAQAIYQEEQELIELEAQMLLDEKLSAQKKEKRERDLALKIEAKKAEIAKLKALAIDFAYDDEGSVPDIADDPQVLQDALRHEYFRQNIEDTFAFKKEKLDEMLAENEISEAEYSDKMLALWTQEIMKWVDIAAQAWTSIDKIVTNFENASLQKYERNNDRKKESLNKQLNDGAISYDQYTARVNQLDENLEKEKRKRARDQAIRSKAFALLMAIVNTAAGVTAQLSIPGAGIGLAIVAAALGALEIAVIATEPVPQLFSGRYPVTGASDGRNYNADYIGNPSTGIVTSPSLISDHGSEMIIDAPTTQKLVYSYPDVIDNIIGLSRGFVPQFKEGRYPDSETANQSETDLLLLTALNILIAKSDEPSKAILVADEDYIRLHNETANDYDDFQKRVN